MYKVLVNMENFDTTNNELVERTIKDLWTLQDIHEEELEIARDNCETKKVSEIKQKIKDTDNDLDILCIILWGDLKR